MSDSLKVLHEIGYSGKTFPLNMLKPGAMAMQSHGTRQLFLYSEVPFVGIA